MEGVPRPTRRGTKTRHMRLQEKWSERTKSLSPLHVGDRVRIHNRIGPNPNKWDRTGTVIEVHQFHQYLIKMDGSGRQTLKNRNFLRKFIPMYHHLNKDLS